MREKRSAESGLNHKQGIIRNNLNRMLFLNKIAATCVTGFGEDIDPVSL